MTHPAIEPHLLGQGRKGDHYVLRVVGDAMVEDGILDGDFVIILREEPRPGDVTVCLIGDDATMRRFYPEGDAVRLVASNFRLKPICVAAKDLTTRGVVVGLMRKFARGGDPR